MEYTFENGVMMGLILASANNSNNSDDISKIRDPKLRYVLQNGILHSECKLTDTYSEKFFYGFCPLLKQNEADAFCYDSIYSEFRPITINKRYNTYDWYNESRVGDSGVGTQYVLQVWESTVYYRNGTPFGCTFNPGNGLSNISLSWNIIAQYANKTQSGSVVGVYAYPTYAYTDIALTLPDPKKAFTAEYTWTYRYGIDLDNPKDVDGASSPIYASFKKWKCALAYETYEITNSDGTVTVKNDYSKVPKIYLDPDSMVEYTEAVVGYSAGTNAHAPQFTRRVLHTDLSDAELCQMEKEYMTGVIQNINYSSSAGFKSTIQDIDTYVNWVERS